MAKKTLVGLVVLVLIFTSLFSACSTTTSTSTTTSNPVMPQSSNVTTPVTTSTQANWWDKLGEPKYGGTLSVYVQPGAPSFDPADIGSSLGYFENLFYPDWKLDRNTHDFTTEFIPIEDYQGALAESWEQTDPLTITIHLRQGVHWQNKAPVNGREFTSNDVVFTYDRILGTGNGYSSPNPFMSGGLTHVEKVIATDKYTVQFKFKNTAAVGLYDIFFGGIFTIDIVAPEWAALGGPPPSATSSAGGPPGGGPPGGPPPGLPPMGVAKTGPLNDWKNGVGTGPFILTDYVSNSSLTYARNPNYYGVDERHPKNQIPYIETLKQVMIPDLQTALAALRSGQLDMLYAPSQLNWQQTQSLAKTNPDIVQSITGIHPGQSLEMRTDKAPFNDIKVREALQLAVDLKTIAKTHYGGEMSGNPEGLISSKYTGWTLPYDQWSQDLKDEYTFNPTKAKELLAEAGYGDGFKTDIIAAGGGLEDIELLEIIKSEFQDIGVTMDIQLFADAGAKMDYAQAGKMDAMTYTNTVGHPRAPFQSIQLRTSTNVENYTYNKDSKYDTMAQQALTAPTIQEAQQLVTDCDMYALKQHWAVNIFGGVDHLCLQPWIKGYSGETMGGASYFYYSRFWISK